MPNNDLSVSDGPSVRKYYIEQHIAIAIIYFCRMMSNPRSRNFLVIICLVSSLCALVAHSYPTDNTASEKLYSIQSPDPESLPPDTFRKLAQALYHSDDKNRLHRHFFHNTSVTCNDGSVAGYYMRKNFQSRRWIIFLEGKH